MHRNTNVIIVLFVFAGLLPLIGNGAETARDKIECEADVNYLMRMAEIFRRLDVAIRFYGKVQDQFDQPVEGAEVVLHITAFSPNAEELFGQTKEVLVKTDSQGRFTVANQKGFSLYIKNIRKAGVAFSVVENSEEYRFSGEDQNYTPNQANPVIFRVRKKGPTVFLLQNRYVEFSIPVAESGKTIGYDIIQRRSIKNIASPVGNETAFVADLQVKATFNTNDATWAVILLPGGTNGGIIVSDQLLYEAPDSGYQAEYTFTPEDRKPLKLKYVYLKTREPAIYTRYEIEYVNAGKKFFRLSGNFLTNPCGDRNLEPETDLPYEVTKQLTDEAKTAFRQNKRPEKPDLSRLLKETKDKSMP